MSKIKANMLFESSDRLYRCLYKTQGFYVLYSLQNTFSSRSEKMSW